MPSKSASSSTKASAKSSKAAPPAPTTRVVSRETIDSDEDMDSEPEVQAPPKTKTKTAEKVSKRAPVEASSSSESESASEAESSSDESEPEVQAGTSQTANYLAPRNMQKVVVASGSDFDYANLLSNPDLQMYTVRLPDNIKTKQLDKLALSVNPSGSGLTGSLSTKSGEYIIKASDPQNAAEELKNLRVLVPSAKKGTYVSAPRNIAAALTLAPIIPVASSSTLPPSSTSTPKSAHYVPPIKPKRAQPLDKMRFRNAAFGGGGDGPEAESSKAEAVVASLTAAVGGTEEVKEKKSKKRKEVSEGGEKEKKKKKKTRTE